MRLIVAGSRGFPLDMRGLIEVLDAHYPRGITELVSGACEDSPDVIGERWAEKACVPVRRFPADWLRFGRRAGPRRNRQMAEYADAALLFWNGVSRGTRNMRTEMERLGKPFAIFTWTK